LFVYKRKRKIFFLFAFQKKMTTILSKAWFGIVTNENDMSATYRDYWTSKVHPIRLWGNFETTMMI